MTTPTTRPTAKRRRDRKNRDRAVVTLFMRGFDLGTLGEWYGLAAREVLDIIREAFTWPRRVLRRCDV